MEDGAMEPGSSSRVKYGGLRNGPWIFLYMYLSSLSLVPHLERMLAAASLQSSKAKTILALPSWLSNISRISSF
jgi:hypothetical protein